MSIIYNFLRPSYMIMNNHAWESHELIGQNKFQKVKKKNAFFF